MSQLPRLKDIVLRDTPFAELMNKRIYNVLLIATKYDVFTLEDDGRVDEQIFNEYTALSLRYPPRFTRVTTKEEALSELQDRNFELIIVMPNMDNRDIFADATDIKHCYPHIPIVVLTPFSHEVSKRVAREDLSAIDYIFSWLGNSELLLAIIKLIEDKWNAPNDSASVGVQSILLVEDSIRFYSSALPHLYRIVLEQSREFSKEALNDHLKTLRMRGRPKILLARTFEEAVSLYNTYKENLLGVISDMSFMHAGRKDQLAGYELCTIFRRETPHVPIILESSDAENHVFAERLQASFITKNTKLYPQQLRQEVMAHFGFGDFIIVNPATGEEVMRIRDLKDLQRHLADIPDASLRYHLSHNHFSRFFFSRAMFPPAVILKDINVEEYASMDEARRFLSDLIAGYRRMKNEGVVAIYQKERFDEFSNFARIGNGSLGGKGRGLAFMGAMVKRYPRLEMENFTVNIPKTVVICTDIFDEFMEVNGLYPKVLQDIPDSEVLALFQSATLPATLLDDLMGLLEIVHNPIAVRSSSLLEDSHYQPFAGVYKTYMIPRVADKQVMLSLLRSAIKAVYASVFYRDSKAYLTATQNIIDQEKMAIVIQEVVGSSHTSEKGGDVRHYFYPTLSGVARSLNFYPIGEEKPEEGIANIAFGLGKYIVDGGRTLRYSPRHPRHILQLGTTEMALRETQHDFYALDVDNLFSSIETDDAFNLSRLTIREAEAHGTLRLAVSTYDAADHVIRDGYYPGGRKVVTFSPILQHGAFPLSETIGHLLDIGRKEMGRPVEIEFVMDIREGVAHFYLLQIRPIVSNKEGLDEGAPAVGTGPVVVSSARVLGNGIIDDVADIVYVKTAGYRPADNPDIAAELEQINVVLAAEGRGYVLIGPGRWGSSDPWLGIPVKWPQICNARVIVESALDSYRVDPSQGTHFFQNLTSFEVGYFTIAPFAGDGSIDEELLTTFKTITETAHVRHVRGQQPFLVRMDGRHQRGEIFAPE